MNETSTPTEGVPPQSDTEPVVTEPASRSLRKVEISTVDALAGFRPTSDRSSTASHHSSTFDMLLKSMEQSGDAKAMLASKVMTLEAEVAALKLQLQGGTTVEPEPQAADP